MTTRIIDLDAVRRSAARLEPLPASVSRIASLVSAEEPDIFAISKAVSLDQALTVRLLRIANSAAARGRAATQTVHQAIVRLGVGVVLALATGAAAKKPLMQALPEYGLSEGALWRQAVAAALTAECARKYCRDPVPGEAFTAALLHGVGKLVLARFLSPEIRDLLSSAYEVEGVQQSRVELELLGISYAQLGGEIAVGWGLPNAIAQAIGYHIDPDDYFELPDKDVRLSTVCDIVHVGSIVAVTVCAGNDPGEVEGRVQLGAASRLGLADGASEDLCRDVVKRFDDTLALYQ